MNLWWNLPNGTSLAFIPRSGSTALANAIIAAYFPELAEKIKLAHAPKGKTVAPQFFIPTSRKPEGTPYALLRDPIDRFRSGFTKVDEDDVEATISKMENGKSVNNHLMPVGKMLSGVDVKVFKFPDDINVVAELLGLKTPIAVENASDSEDKPKLTRMQEMRLRKIYDMENTMLESFRTDDLATAQADITAMKTGVIQK